jgi:hypothetical protein
LLTTLPAATTSSTVHESLYQFSGMKFTKEEIDEIKDALEDSLKYYKDLLEDAPSDPETKKGNFYYVRQNKNH